MYNCLVVVIAGFNIHINPLIPPPSTLLLNDCSLYYQSIFSVFSNKQFLPTSLSCLAQHDTSSLSFHLIYGVALVFHISEALEAYHLLTEILLFASPQYLHSGFPHFSKFISIFNSIVLDKIKKKNPMLEKSSKSVSLSYENYQFSSLNSTPPILLPPFEHTCLFSFTPVYCLTLCLKTQFPLGC